MFNFIEYYSLVEVERLWMSNVKCNINKDSIFTQFFGIIYAIATHRLMINYFQNSNFIRLFHNQNDYREKDNYAFKNWVIDFSVFIFFDNMTRYTDMF